MKTKILIFFLAFFSMLQLQAINIATPISSGAWRSVAWLNLLPNCAYPDNSEFVSYNINLSKDLTLSGAVEVNGLDISADDLSFSVLNGGDLTVENRINANNHNFSINLFSGGKLSCKDFEGFNAYEGRKFSMNFLGGEFVCEGTRGWLRNSARITWNFGGVYNGVFYPAKEKSVNAGRSIEFGSVRGGEHLVNFNLSKENAVSSAKELNYEKAIIFCKDRAGISSFAYDFSHVKIGDFRKGRYYFPLISSKNDVNIDSVKNNSDNMPTFLEFRGVHKKQMQNKKGGAVFLIYIEVEVLE